MTRDRAGLLNGQLEDLSKLTWFTATYPLVLDYTWTGWVLSVDPAALPGGGGQISNNPLTAANPINPVSANTVNNFNTQGSSTINLTGSSAATTITGIQPGVPGQTVTFVNNTDYVVYFPHQSTSSTAESRIITPTQTTLVIPPCHSQSFTYGKGPTQTKWAPTNPSVPYYPLTVPQITTDQTGLDPGNTGAPLVSITSNGNYTIHGIIPGAPYLLRTFINAGNFTLTVPHNSGSAGDPTYAIHTPHDVDVLIGPGRTFDYYYDPVLGANIISGGSALTAPANVAVTGVPGWVKVSKAYTDFSDASTSKTVTLYTLPARGILHKVVIKSSTAWAGTGVTNVLGSVKNNTNTVTTLDLDTAVADSHYSAVEDRDTVSTPYTGLDYVTFAGTRAVALTVDSTGANLDQLTAGAVDVWLLVSKLP